MAPWPSSAPPLSPRHSEHPQPATFDPTRSGPFSGLPMFAGQLFSLYATISSPSVQPVRIKADRASGQARRVRVARATNRYMGREGHRKRIPRPCTPILATVTASGLQSSTGPAWARRTLAGAQREARAGILPGEEQRASGCAWTRSGATGSGGLKVLNLSYALPLPCSAATALQNPLSGARTQRSSRLRPTVSCLLSFRWSERL